MALDGHVPEPITIDDVIEMHMAAYEREITQHVEWLRTREAQRAYLNQLVKPFGFRVMSFPNWRGRGLS